MAESLEHEVHNDFSGGVNQYAGSFLMADNEIVTLENGEYSQFGPVKRTKGYTQRGSDVNDGYEILVVGGIVRSEVKSDFHDFTLNLSLEFFFLIEWKILISRNVRFESL